MDQNRFGILTIQNDSGKSKTWLIGDINTVHIALFHQLTLFETEQLEYFFNYL